MEHWQKEFDQLLARVFEKKQDYSEAWDRNLRDCRRAEYRLAVSVVKAEDNDALLAQLKRRGQTIKEWKDDVFEVSLGVLGYPYERLLAAIKDGMTEKQYVKHGVQEGPESPERGD